MKVFNQETVSNQFAKLPEGTQDVILSSELREALKSAFDSAQLIGDIRTNASQQVTLVMVGLANTKDFEFFVKNEIGLDSTIADTLCQTVSAQVFAPVRDSLLSAFGKNKSTSSTDAPRTDPYKEPV
jgi:hypothetical protein